MLTLSYLVDRSDVMERTHADDNIKRLKWGTVPLKQSRLHKLQVRKRGSSTCTSFSDQPTRNSSKNVYRAIAEGEGSKAVYLKLGFAAERERASSPDPQPTLLRGEKIQQKSGYLFLYTSRTFRMSALRSEKFGMSFSMVSVTHSTPGLFDNAWSSESTSCNVRSFLAWWASCF